MKNLRKIISLILVLTLVFSSGFSVLTSAVFAQEAAGGPPGSAGAPPGSAGSAPGTASAPPATAAPPPPTSAQSAPQTASPAPTSPPAPTSQPLSTSAPQPTLDNSNISPTAGANASPTGDPSNPSPTGNNTNSNTTGNSTSNSTAIGNGISNVNDPANTYTGPKSVNAAMEYVDKKLDAMNQNLADVNNKLNALSSTGFNYANLNTLTGQVVTGDSVSTTNLLNKLNSNMTGVGGFSVYNVYGNYSGDIVFKMLEGGSNSFASSSGTVSKNAVTGSLSNNTADANNGFKVNEANGNDAKLNNDITIGANTGGNTASYNTGGGTVKTGNATALGNIINMVNSNINTSNWLIGVVNIFGSMVGNIILPQGSSTAGSTNSTGAVYSGNSATGPSSNNTADYNNATSDSFQNANSAKVTSNVNVSATTGDNTASANTGGGGIQTGNSNANVSNSTVANTNTTNDDGTVWMVIVNEAGKWVGHIIGAPWGSTAASNTLPVSQTKSGAGIQTFNDGTGPSSTNSAAYNSTADSSVSNNNTANITNNITVDANTGKNEAKYNTGPGIIQTGDAKAGLNLVNLINTNITAKKFVAILVNVMGSLLGDIVTPGQQASPVAGPSVTPTPASVQDKTPSFDSFSGNFGGLTDNVQITNPSPTPTWIQVQVDQPASGTTQYPTGSANNPVYTYNNYNYTYTYSNDNYPADYRQAVNNVNKVKNQLAYQTSYYYYQNAKEKENLNIQIGSLSRTIYMSPAFFKATQSTFPAILLGGATLKVNENWLTIVPFALIFFLIRRRRKFKFDIGKYVNMLLEIVL